MKEHPDSHELDDWQLYRPKSPAIFELVWTLAVSRGMRVAEIERLIEKALRDRLAQADDGGRADGTKE